ncbi:MAG: rRNA maturation RNase YbeY [Candidatus Omnitrophota bacterium]
MEISVRNFQKRVPIEQSFVKRLVRRVLSLEKAASQGEITVCFVNSRAMREVNLNYLGRNLSTDVIAFDLSEQSPRLLIGDILISSDAAFSNARLFKTTPRYELFLYLVHGLLHLLGYNDQTRAGRLLMQKKQEGLLSQCLSIRAKP